MDLCRKVGASLLLIGGCLVLVLATLERISDSGTTFKYEKVDEISPDFPSFPDINSRFSIQKIDRVGFSSPGGHQIALDIAHYQDIAGLWRQAIIFLPEKIARTSPGSSVSDLNQLRWQAWLDAGESFRHSASDKPLFITWWDNAQRIHLLTGINAFVNAPLSEAFEPEQQEFWNHVSGGYGKQSKRLTQLASWLLMDANQALELIKKTIKTNHELLFLVTIDDLARLSEMSALNGMTVPFETRLFRSDENIHRLISRVKRWVREKGNGGYLVQHLNGAGVRVWRITSAEGEKTLLARLLPFTASLANPLPDMELLHRSGWSGYISVYRWRFNEPTIENKTERFNTSDKRKLPRDLIRLKSFP